RSFQRSRFPPRAKLFERSAAMADCGFFFSRKLGGRLTQFWNQEQRIIAKAVAATRSVENLATNFAFERLQQPAVACRSQHANESPLAPVIRNLTHFAQQAAIVGLVGG